MEITQIHNIKFSIEENIVTATISAPNELVILLSSGDVIRYNIEKREKKHLFSVTSNYIGGFDITAKSSIYTLDKIVVVVNDYKTSGFIHYPEKYKGLYFKREDYHADISCYPIALYKNEKNVPHIIYGVAWNHLQIMNLDTRQILTASKSLIEENAEERHIEFYKTYKEDNKLTWPSPYDYFFGKLKMSPNNNNFLSAGWVWGSHDAYCLYDTEDFINNNRIKDKSIGGWEHCNRAVCWINEKTVAITYNPFQEEEENATKDSPSELHFYNVNGSESKIERKIKITGLNIVNSTIHFNKKFNAFVLFSDEVGLVLFSLSGEILFHDKKMNQDAYNSALNLFVKTDEKSIVIHQIKNGKIAITVS